MLQTNLLFRRYIRSCNLNGKLNNNTNIKLINNKFYSILIPQPTVQKNHIAKNIIQSSRIIRNSGIMKGMDILGKDATIEQQKLSIIAYGDHSFQINNILVRQSVILLKEHIILWNVRSFNDLTIDKLVIFTILYPTIEILLIG